MATVELLHTAHLPARTLTAARALLDDALAIAEAGAFSIVIEVVPAALAEEITRRVPVPTIGIGAGPGCDAQVLVINDVLGLNARKPPKFVKPYANLSATIADAVQAYVDDVESGRFPDEEHSYGG